MILLMFEGIILKESLDNDDVLSAVQIINTENRDVPNASENQPNTWTALYYRGDDKEAANIAEQFSHSLADGQWYTNFTTGSGEVYVIFPGKVFTYATGDQKARQEATEFGRSINIPESQLDWSE